VALRFGLLALSKQNAHSQRQLRVGLIKLQIASDDCHDNHNSTTNGDAEDALLSQHGSLLSDSLLLTALKHSDESSREVVRMSGHCLST
jgi:hypothetical protein